MAAKESEQDHTTVIDIPEAVGVFDKFGYQPSGW